MKKLLAIALLITIVLSSCEKQDKAITPNTPTPSPQNGWVDSLEGVWYNQLNDSIILTYHLSFFTDASGATEYWELEEMYIGTGNTFDQDNDGLMSFAITTDTNYFSGVNISSYINKYYHIQNDTLRLSDDPNMSTPIIFTR